MIKDERGFRIYPTTMDMIVHMDELKQRLDEEEAHDEATKRHERERQAQVQPYLMALAAAPEEAPLEQWLAFVHTESEPSRLQRFGSKMLGFFSADEKVAELADHERFFQADPILTPGATKTA